MSRSLLLASLALLTALPLRAHDDFSQAFLHPPASAQPGVYWYWVSGQVTKEGITRDLEAMAHIGIKRAFTTSIDLKDQPRGPVTPLSDTWWDLMAHAIREGKRLGVDIGVFNGPGWSLSGGPWIKPDRAMRYLAISSTTVAGPSEFHASLPQPADQFQDVALVALPAESDQPLDPKIISTLPDAETLIDGNPETFVKLPAHPDNSCQIDLAFPNAVTAQSLELIPARHALKMSCELFAEKPDGAFRSLRQFDFECTGGNRLGPRQYSPLAIAIPPTTAKKFRLVCRLDSPKPSAPFLSEVRISPLPHLERFVEKQLGRLPTSHQPPWTQSQWPPQPEPAGPSPGPRDVRNLTENLAADGTLTWQVPEGRWTLLRVGLAPTGAPNVPASPEATGLEVDKMNPEHAAFHYRSYIGKLRQLVSGDEGSAFKYMILDSYEVGPQNWTDGLQRDFAARYSYDPLPWLPVLTGRIIGGADQSNRFLRDLRRLVADRFADDYILPLRELANKDGLKLWLENYGHVGFPAEFLQYGSRADLTAGEFWTASSLGKIEVRAATSSAHIYNKPVVPCEAFTSAVSWHATPWSLKLRGDWATAEGVNQFILHYYVHQPFSDRLPGINLRFGSPFNRHNTWFPFMASWIDYLRRTHGVLQQGHYVADVLFYTGEDTPMNNGPSTAALPLGYAYDYINSEVIRRDLQVKDGRFVLPGGTEYRLLVLPPVDSMRPELLRKIKELVLAGGAILGAPPTRSPSLQNYPQCDTEIRQLAAGLWPENPAETKAGRGRVFPASTKLSDALQALGTPPDLEGVDQIPVIDADVMHGISWIHRRTETTDVYFLSNQSDDTVTRDFTFRVSHGAPQWWDAVTGRILALPDFTSRGGRTTIPLVLTPRQSCFIVFGSTETPEKQSANFPAYRVVRSLSGPWDVSFDPKLGGPPSTTFAQLTDWTASAEPGIRNYSGPATYRKTIDLSPAKNQRLFLNLGQVADLAAVRLNGKILPTVWTQPARVEITAAVRSGANQLEIEVVNTWDNRLLADAKLPPDQRVTSLSYNGPPDALPGFPAPVTTPLPAGLLGPVTIESHE